jgi:hypothetical protein
LSIESTIKAIGANAFERRTVSTVRFESGTRLREIGSMAFASCNELGAFTVPESVEILGKRCFANCSNLDAIEFEESSKLKRIGEWAFLGCNLLSITIPALTEEMDGSSFVNCPLISIKVARGSLNFTVDGNMLITADGREIVRYIYFGLDPEIVIAKTVRVPGKSCFNGCKHLDVSAWTSENQNWQYLSR